MKKEEKAIMLAILLAGLGLCVAGLFGFVHTGRIERTYVSTTGEVINIRTQKVYNRKKGRQNKYDVSIRYKVEVNGKSYQEIFHPASSQTLYLFPTVIAPFLRKEDQIAIAYNPQHPQKVYLVQYDKTLYLILTAIGTLLLLLGWHISYKSSHSSFSKPKLG